MVTADKVQSTEWFDVAEVGFSTPGERAWHRIADQLKRKRGKNTVGKSRKVGNNTFVYIRGSWLSVRLHNTDILSVWPDGKMRLDTNGWQTVTTKARLNEWLPAPFSIYQENRIWYFVDARVTSSEASRYLYQDGMSISPAGSVEGAELYDPKVIKRTNLLKKRIRAYAKGYVQALVDGKVSKPDSGDCWYCLFEDDKGEEWGRHQAVTRISHAGNTVINQGNHLISHMDRKYYVPTILSRACKEFPTSQMVHWFVGQYWFPSNQVHQWDMNENIEKLVARYMYRRLGFSG